MSRRSAADSYFADLLAPPSPAELALRALAAAKDGEPIPAEALALLRPAALAALQPGTARARAVAFGAALGLGASDAGGRPTKDTAGDWVRIARVVGWMVQRERALIAEGSGKRAAQKQSAAEAVERFHVGLSTAQHWRTAHRERIERDLAEAIARLEREGERAIAHAQQLERIARGGTRRK